MPIFNQEQKEWFKKNKEFKKKYYNLFPNENQNNLLFENEIKTENIVNGNFSEEEEKTGFNLIKLQKRKISRIKGENEDHENVFKRDRSNVKTKNFIVDKIIKDTNEILTKIKYSNDLDDIPKQKKLLITQKEVISKKLLSKKNDKGFLNSHDVSELRLLEKKLENVNEIIHKIKDKEITILENKYYRLFDTKTFTRENFTEKNFSDKEIEIGLSIVGEKEYLEQVKKEKKQQSKDAMRIKRKKELGENNKKLSFVEQAKNRLNR